MREIVIVENRLPRSAALAEFPGDLVNEGWFGRFLHTTSNSVVRVCPKLRCWIMEHRYSLAHCASVPYIERLYSEGMELVV